jgi:hypothetical protein
LSILGGFYKKEGILLGGVSDCEELSGSYSQEFLHAEKYNNYAKEDSGDFNPPIFFPSPHSVLFVWKHLQIIPTESFIYN